MDTKYAKAQKRKKFRKRAGIEPVIGHLKSQVRMGQNFLHGKESSKINAMLAATGWNLRKRMEKLRRELLYFFWIRVRNEKSAFFTIIAQ